MELESLVKGFALDFKCINILSKYEEGVLTSKTSSSFVQLRQDLAGCAKTFNPKQIPPFVIADLYINKHANFLRSSSKIRESHNAKVISSSSVTCGFPGCFFKGSLEKDHTLPKTSYSRNLEEWFDEVENSSFLCKVHNQSFKRDSIGIGLVLRGFIK